MPGSWQYQPYLTTYDSFIFYNAIGEHPDYFYRPIAVAKQVVNGINYRFMTIAEPKQAGYAPHFALVTVYQPPGGQPYATAITPISVYGIKNGGVYSNRPKAAPAAHCTQQNSGSR